MSDVFEFDQAKSAANKLNHGIDFVEAQELWAGGTLAFAPARPLEDELRMAAIGVLDDKHWVAFYTMRGEVIRLISVRRARPKEVEYYESQ
jgi:uncharacterized protein